LIQKLNKEICEQDAIIEGLRKIVPNEEAADKVSYLKLDYFENYQKRTRSSQSGNSRRTSHDYKKNAENK
jgi:hypothetical protein